MPWPFARNLAEKLSAVLASDVPDASSSPSTRFAFKLFRELATADASNVFFSPSSIMLCLAMVQELASGETRQDMAKALEIAGLTPADAQLVIDALKAAFRPRPDVTVRSANSLWGSHHAPGRCNSTPARPRSARRMRRVSARVSLLRSTAIPTMVEVGAPRRLPRWRSKAPRPGALL